MGSVLDVHPPDPGSASKRMWSQFLGEHLGLPWGVYWKRLNGKEVLRGQYHPYTASYSREERAGVAGHAEVCAESRIRSAWSQYHCFVGFDVG